jgi:DNA mismatch repair protein MSH4
LANLLATCRSPLLLTISRTLAHCSFRDLLADIDTILARDTALSRNAQKMRTEIVFAVQSGVNGLLDVARKSYTETVEDMNALLASYQARFGMPTMQLQFVAGRGYHLSLPPPPASTELPPEFVQVQRQAKRWRCSTEALLSLNQRNAESLQEILIITERLLAELVARVGARLAPLLAANDALTQLDMLMAFAALVTKARTPYCKPTISPVLAPIAIKQGRHPVFEQLASTRERGGFVANDLIVGADGRNVLVITGTNMSGKSTLLRQTALIVVLAHIGCFVPADHCTVRVIERLCVRIGDDGAIKSDASSFFVECREVASALAAVSPRALLLIDELGRSTESSVGVALSWSVAEHIALQMRALTLYVTHFSELHRLETLYGDSVRVMHMQVDQMGEHMTARFQLAAGGNARESYGIDVAAQAGFPESLVQEARVIRATLDQHALENKARSAQILEARTAIERTDDALAKRLLALRHSTLSAAPLRAYLNSLATEFQSVMNQQQ